jgi:hypothetical protein
MKANMKGLGGIKHLFLAHGEKVGIVIVGAIALMMIFKSMSREKLPDDKGADDLQSKITQAKSQMESSSWDLAKEQFADQIRIVQPLEQKGGAVDKNDYRSPTANIPWDPSPVPPVVLRTDPVLLEPQNPEATGGAGLLAFVDPAVRRAKMLEEQQKLAKQTAEQKKQADEMAKQEERGGNRARGAEQGPEAGVFDPLHPKRRPVVGMTRPKGVPLQDYEEVRTAYWAVVVAKVPIKEQVQLYKDAFEKARGYNPSGDLPQYLGYLVERAELRGGEESDELKWDRVSVYNGRGQKISSAVTADVLFGKGENATPTAKAKEAVVTKWVGQMPETVDARFLEGGSLAFPLPPLVGREWGREVTHSDIPLAMDGVVLEDTKAKEKAEPAKPGEPEEPEDPFARSARGMAPGMAGAGMGRGMEGGMGRGPGMGMGPGGRGGEFGGMRGGPGMMPGMGRGMEGGGFGGEMGMAGGGFGGRGGFDANGEPQAPHWLLRFFDFSVEPGKKYRYRARLVMLDPNYTVGLEQLDSAVISRVRAAKKAKKSYILTEWSKPSRPVSIPLAGSVFVAGAKPPSDRANDEPRTTLLVESFGMNAGKAIQASKEKDFVRGGVANMTEDAEILVDQGRAIDPYEDFKFQTDITVADIRGGEKLTREASRPARVLLMGPAGQLFVQEETEDLETVEDHRATFAKEAKNGMGGPGFMGEGGMRGGPGMMGGRGGR